MNKSEGAEQRPLLLSLFSGWGGGDCGFHQAGFHPIAAVDNNAHARKCFRLNFPECPIYGWDLQRATGAMMLKKLGLSPYQIATLILSPPCQGISLAGEFNPYDERNILFLRSIRFVDEIKPQSFLIENVAGLKQGKMKVFYNLVVEELEKLSNEYVYKEATLNALHYGVGQDRERVIILGVLKERGVEPSFPEPDLIGAESLRICDINPGIDGIHYGYGGKQFKTKLEFANTFTKTPNLWPARNGKMDEFTPREVLDFCGFPPDWKYTGSLGQVWNRAGNSIMPPFAKVLGEHILTNILKV